MDGIVIQVSPVFCIAFIVVGFVLWYFKLIPMLFGALRKTLHL